MISNNNKIKEIPINSYDDLLPLFKDKDFVYRGEKYAKSENNKPELKTTLESACIRNDRGLQRADVRELDMLREFQRRYHQYSSNPPDDEDTLEWLSIMRHYGAPTRLLDWTYSLTVATFFALRFADRKKDAAVWRLNEDWCERESISALERVQKETNYITQDVEELLKKEFDNIFISPPAWKGIALVNPFRLNVRLRSQRGIFTAVGDVRSGFMENLFSFAGCDDPNNVAKLVIKNTAIDEILLGIANLNISNALLFPDLVGFSEGLGVLDASVWKQ